MPDKSHEAIATDGEYFDDLNDDGPLPDDHMTPS